MKNTAYFIVFDCSCYQINEQAGKGSYPNKKAGLYIWYAVAAIRRYDLVINVKQDACPDEDPKGRFVDGYHHG